ncbi:MAG: hypothetical protein KCHDKBKB_02562 [Elusimicrobia bacterium]|nr:hypothetical protein [Elusimicrobiota bacterium]
MAELYGKAWLIDKLSTVCHGFVTGAIYPSPMRKGMALAALMVLLTTGAMEALQTARPPKLILTNKLNGLESASEFSCSEIIHGYLTLPEKAVGAHTIEGIWVMPNGVVAEHSKNQVEFSAPGRQTAYVWLEFQDKSSGTLGDFRSRGDEPDPVNPQNGEWQVKVLWNGRPLVESKFKVKC